MKLSQQYTLDAGRRSKGFLTRHGAAIGDAVSPILRALLDKAVADLEGYQLEQRTETGLAKGMTAILKEKRKGIHKQFGTPIRSIADNSLSNTPEYLTLLLPSRGRTHGDFLAMAMVLAASAAVHEQVFLEHGMQPDFLAKLNAAIVDLAKATYNRGRHKARSAAAREGLKVADKEVKDALANMDSSMLLVLRRDASLSADWEASRKIHVTITPLPNLGLIAPAKDIPAEAVAPVDRPTPAVATSTPQQQQ